MKEKRRVILEIKMILKPNDDMEFQIEGITYIRWGAYSTLFHSSPKEERKPSHLSLCKKKNNYTANNGFRKINGIFNREK